jgi:antitoxin component YwqK of YwqJK toxin-antitoxin module
MPSVCISIAGFICGLCTVEAENRISAKNNEELAYLTKHPAVQQMLKGLPTNYKIEPKIQYIWSDDEGKPLPHLISLVPLNPKGKPDGAARYFGGEERIVPFRNGKKEGTEKSFSLAERERRLVSETPWKRGKIHGMKKVYHRSNSKLYMEVTYEKGQRQGMEKTYDLPGRLIKATPYKDNKTHGKVIEYHAGTKQAKKVIPFRSGKVHGVVCEYYEDGSLKRELPAQDDRFHGIEKAFDEKGQPTRTRYWLDDEIVSKEEFQKQTN